MKYGWAVLSAIVGIGLLLGALWLWDGVEGRQLDADLRVVEVEEVKNGFLIVFRTKTNPYPIYKLVARDSGEAAGYVKELLHTRVPQPRWGK